MLSLGIDLSASKNKKSYFCLLENLRIKQLGYFKTNKELLELVKIIKPNVIAIDAPLSMPKNKGLRKIEKELRKLGIFAYPPLIPSMKNLTKRGIKIKMLLEKNKFKVIEVFPSAIFQLEPIKNKLKNLNRKEKICKILEAIFGKKFDYNQHLLDSIIAAWLGKLYLEKKFEKVGSTTDFLILPSSAIIRKISSKL